MRIVLAKLQSMTEVQRLQRLEKFKKDGMDTRCEAIEKMPKDIQKKHNDSLSIEELRDLIEYRFLVRMMEIKKTTTSSSSSSSSSENNKEETTKKRGEAKTTKIPQFRFHVGQRVKCNCGNVWQKGTIVKILYREPHWPEGRYVPYQIRLDSNKLIYAPMDDDRLVQAVGRVLKAPPASHSHSHGGHECNHDHGSSSHSSHHGHSHDGRPCNHDHGSLSSSQSSHHGHSHGGRPCNHDHGVHFSHGKSAAKKKNDDHDHHHHSDTSNKTHNSKTTTKRPGLSKRKNVVGKKSMVESTPDDYEGFSL